MLKLDAVGLFVTDMSRMVAFYRDVMHMKTQWNAAQTPNSIPTEYGLLCSVGRTLKA